MRRPSRAWLMVLMVCLGWLLLPAAAEAHAVLVQSFPGQGQRLDKAPPWVELQFNEPVTAAFTPLAVRDTRGQKVDVGDAAVDPQDPTRLSVSLKELDPGLYTAIYRVTSLDGHPIEGTISFVIGDVPFGEIPSDAGGSEVQQVPPAVSLVHGLVQGVAALLAGLTAFLLTVWLPVADPPAARLGRWAGALLLLLTGLGLAELSLYAVRASGEPWSLPLLLTALTGTRVGALWFLRLGLGALAAGALTCLCRPATPWMKGLLLLPGAALLLTLSLQSHAVATGSWLPVVADWLHLLAVAPWLGGLAGFGLVGWPALAAHQPDERNRLLGALVPRFSRLATGAVLLLTLTGLYGAWLHLPSLSALWTTTYGKALLIKLLLLLPVLALGGYNLLRRGDGPFRRAVATELALMTAIFLAAGFLTSLPPAKVEEALQRGPFAETAQAGGLQIELKITPARLGFNQATIALTRPDGTPEAGASTGLRLTMLEHEMGTQNLDAKEISPGLYQVEELVLGMSGQWRVEAVTLTKGGREVRYAFQVEVPDPPSAR